MSKSALQYGIVLIITACLIYSCSNNQYKKLARSSANFSEEQVELIMVGEESEAMRVWKITSETDSLLLRSKSTNVDFSKNDELLNRFISRLYKTVIDSVNAGVGIAAPQVGILKNIIWVQRFDKIDYPFEVYINPIITYYSEEKQPCLEGCLSIPDRMDTTLTRAQTIKIDYLDSLGNSRQEAVEGFTAVIFQHEIDHLNGILYLDKLEH